MRRVLATSAALLVLTVSAVAQEATAGVSTVGTVFIGPGSPPQGAVPGDRQGRF